MKNIMTYVNFLFIIILMISCENKKDKEEKSGVELSNLEELSITYQPVDYLDDNLFFILDTHRHAQQIDIEFNEEYFHSVESYQFNEDGQILIYSITDEEGVFLVENNYNEDSKLISNDLYFDKKKQNDSFFYNYSYESSNGERIIECNIVSQLDDTMRRKIFQKLYDDSNKIVFSYHNSESDKSSLTINFSEGRIASYSVKQPVIEDYSAQIEYHGDMVIEVKIYNMMNEKEYVINYSYNEMEDIEKRTVLRFGEVYQVDEYFYNYNSNSDWIDLNIKSEIEDETYEMSIKRIIGYF